MLPDKMQTPGNYPEESIQHSEQGDSLKSRIIFFIELSRSINDKKLFLN